jgi:hypothetical protein
VDKPGDAITQHLRVVAHERACRAKDAGLAQRVDAVKRFQHARFQESYAHLLRQPRYRDAALFFLEDLYGPADFGERDRQFERVVPGLIRMFSHDIVGTICQLAELHALSEELDTAMARQLVDLPLRWPGYARAGARPVACQARARQIELLHSIGRALDRYTRSSLLRHSLKLLRGPAQLAGIGALHAFLERGFDTFGAMKGAKEFLREIVDQETRLAQTLFDIDPATMPDGYPGELP